ncbi:MAG: hypothetical protein ABSD99_00155 [Candidatus Bathyarchaeia archaeon]|jgi:hypothetical protein
MTDEFDKEQVRGLFATAVLVIFVSALLVGDRIAIFPPNFRVSYVGPLSFLPAFTVSITDIAEFYVILWIVYAFAMSVAYSDSGVSILLQRHPRIRAKLRQTRIIQTSKIIANLSFTAGLIVVLGLGLLMLFWWIWSLMYRGII